MRSWGLAIISYVARLISLMLIAGAVCGGDVFAQQDKETKDAKFFVMGFLAMPSLSMSVNDRELNQTWLDPNRIWSLGLGVEWKGLAGTVSIRTPAQVNDPKLYGETNYLDFQAQLYRKRWGLDSFIQSYKGFFFRDLPVDCERGDPCSRRPDLSIQHAGLLFYYVFNPRWSMRAAFSPPGRQTMSAGSWFVSTGLNLIAISNNGPLVDDLVPAIDASNFYLASIAPGYGYTWVKKKWFFSAAVYVGLGPMYIAYSNSNQQAPLTREWKPAIKAGIKFGTGISGDNWKLGIRLSLDSPVAEIEELDLNWIAQTVELYTGYRF